MSRKILGFMIVVYLAGNPCWAGRSKRIVIDSHGNAYLTELPSKGPSSVIKYHYLGKPPKVKYRIEDKLAIDPTGNKVALPYFSKKDNKYKDGMYYLEVFNAETRKTTIVFEGAGELFSFSPQGDAILYATDYPGLDDRMPPPAGIQPGLWLYDFRSAKKSHISPTAIIWDVNWSEHDGNIYFVVGSEICCYNTKLRKILDTNYKGIYFTSDGKYYASVPYEPPSLIYRTSDNKEMKEWEQDIRIKAGYPDRIIRFVSWSKVLDSGIFTIANYNNVIFNIGKGHVVGDFCGNVIGTNKIGTLALINPCKAKNNMQIADYERIEIVDLIKLASKYPIPK